MDSDDRNQRIPWGLSSKGLKPGSVKNISETKLKAFNIGSMNPKKNLSRKEQDELRRKKEEEETAEVYKDFVDSFDDSKKGLKKAWVKGGLVNPEKGETASEKGDSKLYRPTSKLLEKKLAAESNDRKREEKAEKAAQLKKKMAAGAEKKKTNLELFKEELKFMQEERQERRKVKQAMGLIDPDPERSADNEEPEPIASGASLGINSGAIDDYRMMGGYTYENDSVTTNLYLGNINPKHQWTYAHSMTEMQLCEVFGKFGPLASVKVMWPRTDEERARGRNCGFVAYMNRKDGDRALAALNGKDIMDFEMKLGWGKAVPIPPHPVYIPPSLSELTMPPPPSGLPFNAQPNKVMNDFGQYVSVPPPDGGPTQKDPSLMSAEELDKTLSNAIVKVVIPTERVLLCTIHRMIEFVVREGPMFEAMIMNRELQNPLYRFLFENQSPAHIYYRWKLFSVLQGDSPFQWRTDIFRMFKGGSVWRPPQMNPYSKGMPDELIGEDSNQQEYIPSLLDDIVVKPTAGALTESQRDRLEDMLRELLPERSRIGDAMVWCLEHAENAEEIVDCIAESLSILQTPIPKKIARLFLISDILHNCSAKVPHASFYRKHFETRLPEIFQDVHEAYEKIDARLKAEQFKHRVMSCFRAWEDWSVYQSDYLINLQNIFLGLVSSIKQPASPSGGVKEEDQDGSEAGDDVDGVPLEDIDGAPLDLEPSALKSIVPYDDLDGEPVEEEQTSKKATKPGFKFLTSKWEQVDESELESQAMTVSKWDLLDQKNKEEEQKKSFYVNDAQDDDDDIDGKPMDDNDDDDDDVKVVSKDSTKLWAGAQIDLSALRDEADNSSQKNELSEQRRARLREIEVRVMKFQDELEAGKKSRKPGMSIAEQVEHYRRKQLSKEEERESSRGRERDEGRDWDRSGSRGGERSQGERSEERSRRDERSRDDRSRDDRSRDDRSRDERKNESRSGRRSDESSSRRSRTERGDSPTRSSEYNRSYSSGSGLSGLVSYTRSRSSDSVASYDVDDDDDSSRRIRRSSPRRSSKVDSPAVRSSKRSRSRSPSSRHSKHKRSKR